MANLRAKQESFIKMMTDSEELARHGFALLLKRSQFAEFFDALNEAGLFAPALNPSPVPVEHTGSARLPYWNALDYLVAVAKVAGDTKDNALAAKVLAVLRAVTQRAGDRTRDNYHTWRRFAEMLAVLPSDVVTLEDIDMIPAWLHSQFDRVMVGHALHDGALRRFVRSDSAADWRKALQILRHCTSLRWVDAEESTDGSGTPTTVVDDYWLKIMIDQHSFAIGSKTGIHSAELFVERVKEVFGPMSRRTASRLFRPAVEDHGQNHRWREAENRMVEGLRNVLLGWSDREAEEVAPFVSVLLHDDFEIVRRIGIYLLNQHWASFRDLYLPVVGPELFQPAHLHELYHLLRDRFCEMTTREQAATAEAIRGLPRPAWATDPDLSLKRTQRQWLSAIAGQGDPAIDAWSFELANIKGVGLSDHPDFDVYMTVRWGPEATPYDVQALVSFAQEGVIVRKLNTFEPAAGWSGPTMDGLVAALQEAVHREPDTFMDILSQFLEAKRCFQRAVLWGLKRAWDDTNGHTVVDWGRRWEQLVVFFEAIVESEGFWNDAAATAATTDRDLNCDWIASTMSDFIKAANQDDERAFAVIVMPRTERLLTLLVRRTNSVDGYPDDAMMQAINSPKGKAVEALFAHTFRACQIADREGGAHNQTWASVKPLFDSELAECRDGNYEVSTLSAAYITQLDYIDDAWLRASVSKIFPADFHNNAACAVDGLGYAQTNLPIYELLAGEGAIDLALRLELKGRYARTKLIERIVLAYLWAGEELESSRFVFLFRSEGGHDLECATRFLWSVSGEALSIDQIERVIRFWRRCIQWAGVATEPPSSLLSGLSRLTCYLQTVSGEEAELILAVAPFVAVDHNAEYFIEELHRFVDNSPGEVNIFLRSVLRTYRPSFDFEDHLKSLLRKLADKGFKDDVLRYIDELRDIPGMQQLFNDLTRHD